ncbi:hypothetical protein KW791_00525 [Candidatus Parcubacteria bacterium]|nr:hypothetical protein [Candidatus Parcubacteria bacterium]
MTFADQQTLLSVLLGDSNTSTDDAFSLTTRKLFLNRGELHFCKDSKCVREKAAGTISGTQLVFPSGILRPVALIVNGKDIWNDRQTSITEYERWNTSGSAYPAVYITEESGSRYFNFWGSSNGKAYILHYIRKPTVALSSDSDESILQDEFREASVYWAAAELLQQVGKNTIADKYAAKYNKFVRDGEAYGEEIYLNLMFAKPDTNLIDAGDADVVGQGFDFA